MDMSPDSGVQDLIRREGLAPRPVTVADNFKPEHYL